MNKIAFQPGLPTLDSDEPANLNDRSHIMPTRRITSIALNKYHNSRLHIIIAVICCIISVIICGTAVPGHTIDVVPGLWKDTKTGLEFNVSKTGQIYSIYFNKKINVDCANSRYEDFSSTRSATFVDTVTRVNIISNGFSASNTIKKNTTGNNNTFQYSINGSIYSSPFNVANGKY